MSTFRPAYLHCVIASLLIIISSSEAVASRVYYEKLSKVLPQAKLILVCEVEKAIAGKPQRYQLRKMESIAGDIDVDKLHVFFSFPSFTRGKLRVSPIVSQSGIETNLSVGKQYIFFFSETAPDSNGEMYLLRAEPLSKRAQSAERDNADRRGAPRAIQLKASSRITS